MTDRNTCVAENIGLVHACCHRFMGRGIEYDDLFQAGCVGLIRAADGFDKSRGVMFSTFAVPAILGEIRRLFRDGGTVKVSRTLKELAMKVSRTQEQLSKELGRDPSVSEIAMRLDVSPAEAAEALCSMQPVISLTYENDEGERTELNLPVPDDSEKVCDCVSLQQALEKLPEQDRRLIELRYFSECTQTQTAEKLGMTQVQVSRREKVILSKIRKNFA